eukprot:PLAT10019.1.p2 GENE.PLAT10019.1~~PLAT10019.1.p2  ORF type:complete len:517 (+),score=253.90 PLAT10019.1:30-1580(+)
MQLVGSITIRIFSSPSSQAGIPSTRIASTNHFQHVRIPFTMSEEAKIDPVVDVEDDFDGEDDAALAKCSTAEVTSEFVASSAAVTWAQPINRLARNAVTQGDVSSVVFDRDAFVALDHVFSHRVVPEGSATAQKSSGRCWMFAALNCARVAMMRKFSLPSDFELSQSYLFFWDKLEKSNYFLESIMDTASEPVDSRLVQYLLQAPVNDGGQWDMLVNLINKYGVVPKSAFPECHSSSASRRLNWVITNKLREFARTLRSMVADGKSEGELREAKGDMLNTIHRILLINFGEPPSSFDWAFYDKDKKYHSHTGLTPQRFYRDFVVTAGFDVNSKVSLIHDPRNDYYKLYTVDRLGNVVGGQPTLYINLPISDLAKYARQIIERGDPVWFGCDVGKFFDRKLGVMDLDLFDYSVVYGTSDDMTKADRLIYGESLMTHAMVFTGFDASPDGPTPSKWRVENSWGDKLGDKGYFILTAPWFDEYVYQIAADKSVLPEEVLEILTQEPTVYPAWDPFGSLA